VTQKIFQNGGTVVEPTEDSSRTTARVNLSAAANSFLDSVRQRTGVPKEVALARILEWYVSLSPKLQLAVLNKDEGTRDELLRMALAELAGLPQGEQMPATLDEAIAVAKAGLARVEHIAKVYKRELAERMEARPAKRK
jgi:hypothetical protein